MNERKMQIKIIILLNKKLLYISKINCDECKENKKSNTYNNETLFQRIKETWLNELIIIIWQILL